MTAEELLEKAVEWLTANAKGYFNDRTGNLNLPVKSEFYDDWMIQDFKKAMDIEISKK